MGRLCSSAALFVTAGLATAFAQASAAQTVTQLMVAAHRGGMAHRPENTIPAFRHAVEIGVSMLEFDLGVTSDNQLVIHHDSAVNGRICSSPTVKPGPIHTLTLQQILTFDCGKASLPGQKAIPGTRMPTFDEFLKTFAGSNVVFLGETKMAPDGSPGFTPPDQFVRLIVEKLRKYDVADRFILQSGDYRTIEEMRKQEPRARLCLLNARRFKPDYVKVLQEHPAHYMMLNYNDIDAAGLGTLAAMGAKFISSTANTPEDWAKYRSLRFDAILTDRPEDVMRYLGEGKGR